MANSGFQRSGHIHNGESAVVARSGGGWGVSLTLFITASQGVTLESVGIGGKQPASPGPNGAVFGVVLNSHPDELKIHADAHGWVNWEVLGTSTRV